MTSLTCSECADHAAEEHLPGQPHAPVRGDLLHGEEQPADGGAESGGDAGRGAGADEVAPVLKKYTKTLKCVTSIN